MYHAVSCALTGYGTNAFDYREIIDESDVFVDVHKAIRRMTPAPKSRVPKGKIVEEPPMLSSQPAQGTLVDVGAEGRARRQSEGRRSSVEAPLARFQLRKQQPDKNSGSPDGWVTQRGTTDEIREHLKHLGPSNLASRPRHTRYQSVKIKRAGGSPTRSGQTDGESALSTSGSGHRRANSLGLPGGIGAGLLQSGGLEARDGAHALRLGYDTMSQTPATDTGTQTKDGSGVNIPEAVREEQDEYGRSAGSSAAVSIWSSDSRSQDRLKPSNYQHQGPARSGSITEQVVDVNGIRKVVLHTTSTSSSDEEYGAKYQLRPDGSIPDLNDTEMSNTNGSKKRRRRHKRGKNSKGAPDDQEESALLLPQ